MAYKELDRKAIKIILDAAVPEDELSIKRMVQIANYIGRLEAIVDKTKQIIEQFESEEPESSEFCVVELLLAEEMIKNIEGNKSEKNPIGSFDEYVLNEQEKLSTKENDNGGK